MNHNTIIEAHNVRVWVNKATTDEGRTQHRVMYYTPTLGKPALCAADGYRIHAAWDIPDVALVPSKRITPTVQLLGKARRNKQVISKAREWMRGQNPMGELLGKLEGQQVCTVYTAELRRCLSAIWRQYRADGFRRDVGVLPVYLWFVPQFGLISVYSNTRCVGTARAIYTRTPDAPIVGLQLSFLWDALIAHYGYEDVEIAQSSHGGHGASMLGIGAWMHRYAAIMPLAMVGKMPDVIRAEMCRDT